MELDRDRLLGGLLKSLGEEKRKQLLDALQTVRNRFPNADIYTSRLTENGDRRLTIGVKNIGSVKGLHRVFVISPHIEKFSPDAELFLTVSSGSKKRSALVAKISGMDKYRRERGVRVFYDIPLSRLDKMALVLSRMASIALFKRHLDGSCRTPIDYHHDDELRKVLTWIESVSADTALRETEKDALIKVRIGQGYFRDQLMARWGGKCAVTSCTEAGLLRASHIRPWAEHPESRLDASNGILLSVTYDALFDQHLITFAEDGGIVLSRHLGPETIKALDIRTNACISLDPEQQAHLRYHRATFAKKEARQP